ncbi:MAG TPA: hypothetical protein VHP36_01470 [Chitinispirillaceae bacterium]|nr:hypothetical protein [Chitinispirillaceae bacterium]
MNHLLAAIFLIFNNTVDSTTETASATEKLADTNQVNSTLDQNDELIKQMYHFNTDSSQVINKDHLLKNDPQTTRELELKELDRLGKEYQETNKRRNNHKKR